MPSQVQYVTPETSQIARDAVKALRIARREAGIQQRALAREAKQNARERERRDQELARALHRQEAVNLKGARDDIRRRRRLEELDLQPGGQLEAAAVGWGTTLLAHLIRLVTRVGRAMGRLAIPLSIILLFLLFGLSYAERPPVGGETAVVDYGILHACEQCPWSPSGSGTPVLALRMPEGYNCRAWTYAGDARIDTVFDTGAARQYLRSSANTIERRRALLTCSTSNRSSAWGSRMGPR